MYQANNIVKGHYIYSYLKSCFVENYTNRKSNEHILYLQLWKFNLASRRWTKLRTRGEMPVELASHSGLSLPLPAQYL